MKTNREEALAYLRRNDHFLLICHDNPDGDTLGSALGLFFALKKIGKAVRIACGDPVPKKYQTLPAWEEVRLSSKVVLGEDKVIYIDIAHPDLIRKSAHLMMDDSLSLDHHLSSSDYAGITYCRPDAAAAGEIVLEMIHELSVTLDHDIAKCLFYAISTDTGHFEYSNTSANSFLSAGELMQYDLELSAYCRELYRMNAVSKTRLIGRTIANMRLVGDGSAAYSVITTRDIEECGADPAETEGLIDFLRDMQGIEICALLKELPNGTVKVSLRSLGKVNCSEAASQYNGGGHIGAAGFSLDQKIDEAAETVAKLLGSLI